MPVEITAREVFDQLQALNVNVAVLCEKVDRLGPDHEQRLRALEGNRWPLPVIAGLGAAGVIFVLVKDLILLGS